MMDVQLPGLNGDDVTMQLKTNRSTRNIPVVINTGWTTACNIEEHVERARPFVEAGLLDELTLYVHPVVVGKGKRLFKDGSELKRLKLVDNKTTSTGVAILTYQPR